ncbi:hypothetical protein FisN_10Hu075 [Fistulifera solaris]|uniref:Phospholipid/glycerol acyltransferase domain-containing protein n=1 Tax=Fistulifera solaris TaxID=1519565 RepID=A0A1Z5JXE5_FISSO|nr:hypothetical protein FisN_10Hu075 [Fistulifera solaris]|eukprot:GAX18710.1 hypothetical protein FisN_10Hu075 [Fistulifera solaris]
MLAANHSSWMDTFYLGATVGWRNFSLISKNEVQRVPILGKAIEVGGNILPGSRSTRSQVAAHDVEKGNSIPVLTRLCTFVKVSRGNTCAYKKSRAL